MQVFTTLVSGGDFKPLHVQVLSREVLAHSPPGTTFTCLSDVAIPGVDTIPLKMGWPTWWGKMELLGPEFKGDMLFMDIDTVIVGPLDDILKPGQPLTMHRGCGGLMFLPEADRKKPGEIFRANPERIIDEWYHEDGFLCAVWSGRFTLPRSSSNTEESVRICSAQYADVLPGQIVYRRRPVPFQRPRPIVCGPNARLVMFAGLPRPWRTPEYRHLYK